MTKANSPHAAFRWTLLFSLALLGVGGGWAAAQSDGSWTGSTGQGRAVSFTVLSGGTAIQPLSFGFSSSCGTGTTTVTSSIPISGNSFSTSGGFCPSYSMQGTFSSATAASGSLVLTYTYIPYACPCSGTINTTWSASAGCSRSIAPVSVDVAAAGATGSVAVTAECAWTAVSNDSWITVTSGASGSGNGTVEYSVATNTGAPRTGTVTIATKTFTVNQGAEGCYYSINPTGAGAPPAGGSGSVAVTTAAGCAWTAISNDAWITVTSGASGSGDGSVAYTVAADSGSGRTGTITIAGLTFTVSQGLFADIGAVLTGVNEGSVGWGDFDNDGDLDVLLTGSMAKIYRNDGGGAFSEVPAGLTPVNWSSADWGDYDNDGDLDIALIGCAQTGPSGCSSQVSKIYRNDGGGSFADIEAALTGVDVGAIAWGDYDNDGDLDILLAGRAASGRVTKVYRNDGGGVFSDIGVGLIGVNAVSLAWGDYDNDGDLDILLSGYTGSGRVSRIYRNEGGVFADIAAGLTPVQDKNSAAWGDYDNDGDLDALLAGCANITSYACSSRVARVFRNDGSGVFTDASAGLTGVENGSVAWGDYDNDGDLDILLTGRVSGSPSFTPITKLYRNEGGAVFTEVAVGLTATSYGSARWGDYDNDGSLDILLSGRTAEGSYIARIIRNNNINTNTIPAAPTDLGAAVAADQATLSWGASTDAQTPAAGLTYNVRIGITPGGVQVSPPMAAGDSGYRRVVQLGNANQGTTAIIKSLPSGTYYWSVQAVDTAFAGSPFASEGSFVIEAVSPSQLTVSRSGAGSGVVTSSPSGIDCGSDCSESYATGTVVTLSAAAAAGSTFAGWSGEACSGIGACEVTMSQARTVTAMFVPSVASAFYPLTPCRVFDTRVDSGSTAGAPVLSIGERRLFTIAGGCGVPLDATAISANVTVVGAAAIGDLRVTGGHVLDTITSALSIPLSRARANNAVIELSANGDGTIAVTNPTAGTVHVILDVNGYFK